MNEFLKKFLKLVVIMYLIVIAGCIITQNYAVAMIEFISGIFIIVVLIAEIFITGGFED